MHAAAALPGRICLQYLHQQSAQLQVSRVAARFECMQLLPCLAASAYNTFINRVRSYR
jgi:hypothetical protein